MGLWKAKGGEVVTGYAAGGELMLMVFQPLASGGGKAALSIEPGEARKMAAEILACTGGLPTHDELLGMVEVVSDAPGEGS